MSKRPSELCQKCFHQNKDVRNAPCNGCLAGLGYAEFTELKGDKK